MFDWAIRSGKIEGANPAKGHHRSQGEHEVDVEGARRSFTTEELKRLFGGSLFAATFAERTEPTHHTVETTLSWLIPIALYSGMRLDEICGLRTADVMEDEGAQYFDIPARMFDQFPDAPMGGQMLFFEQFAQEPGIAADGHKLL